MSATDDLGSHLLGRRPSPPDPRDYRLAHFLTPDPLDELLAAVVHKHYSHALKAWATAITTRVKILGPAPAPPEPPPDTGDVIWANTNEVLDQGQTPHCCGFGSAQWGNTAPIDDRFTNRDGDALYYEMKILDGEPGQEDGSYARSAAQALQNRKRLSAYAFAGSEAEIRAWVHDHGPIMFATDWDDPMFDPDPAGFVHPDASKVAGGHFYVIVGDLPGEGAYLCLNSWGPSWGQQGRFKLTYDDAAQLLARRGEAVAAVELPL